MLRYHKQFKPPCSDARDVARGMTTAEAVGTPPPPRRYRYRGASVYCIILYYIILCYSIVYHINLHCITYITLHDIILMYSMLYDRSPDRRSRARGTREGARPPEAGEPPLAHGLGGLPCFFGSTSCFSP